MSCRCIGAFRKQDWEKKHLVNKRSKKHIGLTTFKGSQAEEEYEAALAARRAEMEAELLRKDLEQLQLLGQHSRPQSADSLPSLPSLPEDPLPSAAGKNPGAQCVV